MISWGTALPYCCGNDPPTELGCLHPSLWRTHLGVRGQALSSDQSPLGGGCAFPLTCRWVLACCALSVFGSGLGKGPGQSLCRDASCPTPFLVHAVVSGGPLGAVLCEGEQTPPLVTPVAAFCVLLPRSTCRWAACPRGALVTGMRSPVLCGQPFLLSPRGGHLGGWQYFQTSNDAATTSRTLLYFHTVPGASSRQVPRGGCWVRGGARELGSVGPASCPCGSPGPTASAQPCQPPALPGSAGVSRWLCASSPEGGSWYLLPARRALFAVSGLVISCLLSFGFLVIFTHALNALPIAGYYRACCQ